MIRQKLSNALELGLDKMSYRRAPGLPEQLHLSVTDRCFLPCLHCDIWKNDTVDLPTEVWLSTIDRLGKWCGPACMNFVGGETLLRKDLELLVSRAVGHGFTVSFNTNGYLVTKSRAESLAQAGASIAYVSMDGLEKKTVDHSRGREGSYEKALTALKHFSEYSIQPIVACILHAHNANQMLPLLDWCEHRGYQLVIQPLYQNFGNVEYDPNWWRESEFWPHKKEEIELLEQTLDLLTVARNQGRAICNQAMQLQAMKFHFRAGSGDLGLSCRAGHSDLSIDPQGKVRLCYFLEPVGDIFEERSFDDIWHDWQTLRRRWQVSRCGRRCNLLNCNFDREGV
ncbi:MAG: hypothetical protein CMK59_11060 [Proteobacteria bacterium]|nr:hypothetical protein [Pseudomonadota bacterium]